MLVTDAAGGRGLDDASTLTLPSVMTLQFCKPSMTAFEIRTLYADGVGCLAAAMNWPH